MEVDESPLELIVINSIKAAYEAACRIIRKRGNVIQKAEQIGIFVTCLRTEFISREVHSNLPAELKPLFDQAKIDLCKTENWRDVGVYGAADFGIRSTPSGRWKRSRIFDSEGRGRGVRFNAEFGETVYSGTITSNKTEGDMDKTRIGQLASQAKKDTDGFDYTASFASMEQTLRDMNLMAKQHEHLGEQATQVAQGLCTVAESLAS